MNAMRPPSLAILFEAEGAGIKGGAAVKVAHVKYGVVEAGDIDLTWRLFGHDHSSCQPRYQTAQPGGR
jgi:hypothetical protein